MNIIKSLEKNIALRELHLGRSKITDDDILALDRLIDLELLSLYSCTFLTNQTVEDLYEFIEKRAINLKRIMLLNTPNIEQHIQMIIDKPTIHLISIESDKITDEIISNIKIPVGHQKRIIIKSNSISDVGLMQIKCITPNIELYLYTTTITKEGLKNFLLANPLITGNYNDTHSEVMLRHK